MRESAHGTRRRFPRRPQVGAAPILFAAILPGARASQHRRHPGSRCHRLSERHAAMLATGFGRTRRLGHPCSSPTDRWPTKELRRTRVYRSPKQEIKTEFFERDFPLTPVASHLRTAGDMEPIAMIPFVAARPWPAEQFFLRFGQSRVVGLSVRLRSRLHGSGVHRAHDQAGICGYTHDGQCAQRTALCLAGADRSPELTAPSVGAKMWFTFLVLVLDHAVDSAGP